MHCPKCAVENPEGNSFCEACGAQLATRCPKCGTPTALGARFCGACGNEVASGHGERKRATILFADVVGSTALISGLDAEQALEALRPAVEAMCVTVQRFDGTVVRTLGDGIMAAFGIPRAQEGHALLACEAALAIRSQFQGTPSIRIGLHSGEVVSSVLASDPTKEQGAHGSTVHLASRVQGLAEPGGICLTEDCYKLVMPYCEVQLLGRRAVRGFKQKVSIYSLLALKPAVASQQFHGTTLSQFRGRDDPFRILQQCVAGSATTRSNIIGISGAPGLGKSRLCYEFAEWCRGRLIPVLEARAQPYGHATPLQPVLEFLRLLFQISPDDNSDSARRQITDRVLAITPTFEADLPVLFELLGVAHESAESTLHPKARHARLMDIVRHMIRQIGRETAVIIIEDLHWMDDASDDFIMTIADAVVGTRASLILNYRPSYSAPWMSSPHFREIALSELDQSATAELVEQLLGPRPELQIVRERIAARSGGNPFFAEELVRSLSENGALQRYERPPHSLRDKDEDMPLPVSVEAVIGARIDRLAMLEKAVLQICAVLGKEFPLTILQQVVGRQSANLEKVLARLCELGMLRDQTVGEYRQLSFRHPLIQEVAYTTQLKSRRSELHASAAKAISGYFWDRLDEFSGLIAYHYESAGQLPEAAHFSISAAKWIGSTAPGPAIKHWEIVRRIMERLPRSPLNDADRIMASAQIAWLGWREGMTAEEAKPYLDEALRWARETDDSMIPMLLFVDGRITVASGGSADLFVDRVKEALSLVHQGQQIGRAATLNCALSQAYGWAGLLNEALAANDAAMADAASVESFDNQFLGYRVDHWAVSLRGRILVRLGRFREAAACLDEMLGIEDRLLDPTLHFIPHLGYVDLAWCQGDAKLAKRHALRVAEIAEKSDTAYLKVYAFSCSGTAKSLAGDYAGAVRDFTEGLKFVGTMKASVGYEPEIAASLADCFLQTGQLQEAVDVARNAIKTSRERNTRLAECRASIICASALAAERKIMALGEVAELLDRAEALIARTGASIYTPLLQKARALTGLKRATVA